MPKISPFDDECYDEFTDRPRKSTRRGRTENRVEPRERHVRRPDGSEEFKCGHCRAFIGPTVSGGKHRNHCPLCLYSRHVDRGQPGDRASECRSLMAPIGIVYRSNGEQMLVHRCLGCGAARRNRVAADDNPLVCLQLEPLAALPAPDASFAEESAIA